MSGCIAFRVIAVSISVSPFFTDELPTAMFITSAPSRLPASSKEDWVRVEASKNRLMMRAPAQRAALLLDLAVEIDVFVGEVEQPDNLVGRKSFDPQQVTAAEDE